MVARRMRILKNRWFAKFTRREDISDAALIEAIERANAGLVDADLGGGLLKQRVAREGQDDREATGRSSFFAPRTVPFSSSASPREIGRTSMRTNW